jgi:hypothetical protein
MLKLYKRRGEGKSRLAFKGNKLLREGVGELHPHPLPFKQLFPDQDMDDDISLGLPFKI